MKKSKLRKMIREEIAEAVGYTRADAAYKQISQAMKETPGVRKFWNHLHPNGKVVWLLKLQKYKLTRQEAEELRDKLDSKREMSFESIKEERIRMLQKWPKQVGSGDGSSSYVYMHDNGYELEISKGGKPAHASIWPSLASASKLNNEYKKLGAAKFLKKYKSYNGYDGR